MRRLTPGDRGAELELLEQTEIGSPLDNARGTRHLRPKVEGIDGPSPLHWEQIVGAACRTVQVATAMGDMGRRPEAPYLDNCATYTGSVPATLCLRFGVGVLMRCRGTVRCGER